MVCVHWITTGKRPRQKTLPKLGVDPGFANLGLCVIDDESPRILASRCISLGHRKDYASWHVHAQRVLKGLAETYNIDGIAMEAPPVLHDEEVTRLLWYTCGLVLGAIGLKGSARIISASVVKKHTAQVLGVSWNKDNVPTKSEVRASIETIYGTRLTTSHEADAAMIATIVFFRPRLAEGARLWRLKTSSPETPISPAPLP